MKQVSNSLLTLCPIPFKAFPDASAFPRDIAGAEGHRFTPFYNRRKEAEVLFCALPGLSCSPRSFVRIGLGEGRIRSLLRYVSPGLLIALVSLAFSFVAPASGSGSEKRNEVPVQGVPDPGELAAALKSHIVATSSWKESEIEIRSISSLAAIELPSADVELRLAPGATFSGRKKIVAPFDIVQSGKTIQSLWITAEVSIRASILTAARKISVNKSVTPEDIVQTAAEIPDIRMDYARRPEDLIGKVARRGFAPGVPLTLESFADPFLVRHGEMVQLRLQRNGIILTSQAKAQQDGKLGQIITVRNLEFSTPLKAQVTGRGAVQIQ
jgi:flagella basal body P-ring formation protein FlgA